MELQIIRSIPPGGVQTLQSQRGRTYWRITDSTGKEWSCFTANVAMAAANIPPGTPAQMTVRVTARQDGQGMNYNLQGIAPAMPGQPETPAGQEDGAMSFPGMPQPNPGLPQQLFPQQGFQQQGFAGAAQPQIPGAVQTPFPQMPAGGAQLPPPPQRTLGQGGTFTDADLARMARSTAVEAVTRLAASPDFAPEFRDEENNWDWQRFYLAAEALSKFITHRAHEGWVPGQQISAPDREQEVLAEIQNTFPGTTQLGMPEVGDPLASQAENAGGGEADWE
jgi:hypothetical protein